MRYTIEQQRFQTDVYRKFCAIPTHPGELQPGSHLTGDRGSEIVLPMANVGLSEALRQEDFELLSYGLLMRIAKQDFCLLVYHYDRSGLIDDDQGVRRNVKELVQAVRSDLHWHRQGRFIGNR